MKKVLYILVFIFICSTTMGCTQRKPVNVVPDVPEHYTETIQNFEQSKPKIETILFEAEEGTYRIFTAVKANCVSIHVMRADK